jgi:hypothetical protein
VCKVYKASDTAYAFDCPGCGHQHCFYTCPPPHDWKWNGDYDKPTVTPSIRNSVKNDKGEWVTSCHLIITDGKIEYCGDCIHDLKGQTIDMVDIK